MSLHVNTHSTQHPTDTDIVSLSALQLAVTVGPDHWHRTRPQPAQLSVQLHLSPGYLNTSGLSDEVTDSLHYGHLAKAMQKRVSNRPEQGGYPSTRALLEDVTDAAFAFVRDAVSPQDENHEEDGYGSLAAEVLHAVRVVLQLPKQILLAEGFETELTTPGKWTESTVRSKSKSGVMVVRVKDLVLPVIIGVNPPERRAKQRVVTHLTFFEGHRTTNVEGAEEQDFQVDYPTILQQVVTEVENSSHLTLEKLVYEIIQTAYRASDAQPCSSPHGATQIQAITVRCQKPSALSFADASEIEMTRARE